MSTKAIKSEFLPWSEAGVWICTKCFQGQSVAENLKTEFKNRLRDKAMAHQVRVMTSSCLGICPEKAQAAVLIKKNFDQEGIVFDPEKDKEDVFQRLL